jgi:hypothetical protein
MSTEPINDLQAQLAEALDEAEWQWLQPHVERDVVILVSPKLDLVNVAEVIANDQVAVVQDWIAQQLIYKPSPALVEEWNQTPERRFKAVIVQPYVLLQDIPGASQN